MVEVLTVIEQQCAPHNISPLLKKKSILMNIERNVCLSEIGMTSLIECSVVYNGLKALNWFI